VLYSQPGSEYDVPKSARDSVSGIVTSKVVPIVVALEAVKVASGLCLHMMKGVVRHVVYEVARADAEHYQQHVLTLVKLCKG